MPDLEYCRPRSLGDAIAILSANGDGAVPLAGGTDLIVRLKRRRLGASCLVDLKAIAELRGVDRDGPSLRIGALTTHAELIASPPIRTEVPVLARAARAMAFPEIRNRGTIGGNICNADASADLVPPLMALGASVRLAGPDGQREVPLSDCIVGARQTMLRSGEILVAISVPVRSPNTACAYARHSTRRVGGIAVASAAALVAIQDGVCSEARVVIGALEAKPKLIEEAPAYLIGRPLGADVVRAAARASVNGLSPLPDPVLPASYRLTMAEVMVRQALEEAWTEVMDRCAAPSP